MTLLNLSRFAHRHNKYFMLFLFTLYLGKAQATDLIITNVSILSGEDPKPSAQLNVHIDNGRIIYIGEKLSKASKIINGENKYLIPGLIDTHVHLVGGIPGLNTKEEQQTELVQTALSQIPKSYLYFGFTTLLDLNSYSGFIDTWNKQDLSPKAYFCSPIIIPNGYPITPNRRQEQFESSEAAHIIFNPKQASLYPEDFPREARSPENMVKMAKKDGALCIKVFYEEGFGQWQNLPVPSIELVKQIVKQAHEQSMKVYLHGNSQSSYEFALKTKVDTIVHGLWHWKSVSSADNSEITELAQAITNSNIAVQPTIQVIHGEQELFNPQYFENDLLKHAIPQSLITWYKSDEGQWMKNVLRKQFPANINESSELYQIVKDAYKKPIGRVQVMTEMLFKNKGKLLFGSDTPSGPIYTQFPGVNGRMEMLRWYESGIDLKTLFESMTVRNAQAMNLQDEIGQIEVGMKANLIILKDNPIQHIAAYDTIETVIIDGLPIARESLSAISKKGN